LPVIFNRKNKFMTKPNRLINETSPYLLQHAYNPVDWFPWSEEAFEKARLEDKPVFLSIGYSTCHWCHVMERESFEDEEVAALMKRVFISIKVDREERPDIDNIYMMVCQMMNGNGGWPLSIIMTPDRKPFFSGTYFPKENRYGRIGFKELIHGIESAWQNRREEILKSSEEITGYLSGIYEKGATVKIDGQILTKAFESFSTRFDSRYGGFGSAPKFPSPHNLLFLLRYWKRSGNAGALEIVIKTLTAMRMGGIYDQVGYGFHRYSTDKEWLVPHFEKMLYDQALLITAYSEAYQATGNPLFRRTVEETIDYLMRDMRFSAGAFYSGEDADSEGEEGKFYVWSNKEIIEAIGLKDASFVFRIFNTDEKGNFLEESTKQLNGNNILHLNKSYEELAVEFNMPLESLEEKITSLRSRLLNYREKRVRPFKDDKILTDWNSLVIAALSIAGRVFDNPEYIRSAETVYNFIRSEMSEGFLLKHSYRDGKKSAEGILDDYSFLIWGLIELYESTLKDSYILDAVKYCETVVQKFHDTEHGGFYFTSGEDSSLLMRTKEIYDGAIPSGNSVMFYNLIRLARISADPRYEEVAQRLLESFSDNISRAPTGSTFLLGSLDYLYGNSYEIIIAFKEKDEKTLDLLKELNRHYRPNKVIIPRKEDTAPPFEYLLNYLSDKGNPLVYVCKNYKCELPVRDKEKLRSILDVGNPHLF